MVESKQVVGQQTPKDLWQQEVLPVSVKQFAKATAGTEKIIWYGESNSGKTRGYLDVLGHMKSLGIPREKVCMCVVFSDRATGITKLYHLIPKEYVERVFIFQVNNYEDMVRATARSEKILIDHFKKTGVHGWLIIELLEEAWRMAQDYYSRKAFGESLADLMSVKRQEIQKLMVAKGKEDKDTAYQALAGFRDWVVIKFFHNFNWIDKIKRMPFNVGATAEIKAEVNKDSMFFHIGVRPAGEKDNAHRFDTIIYKKHQGDKFYQQCFKLTGYNRIYSEVDITDKNGYTEHQEILRKFEKAGYKSSAIEELEKEAGIPTPKPVPPVEKKEAKPEPEKKEEVKAKPKPEGVHGAIEDHEKMALEKAAKKPIIEITKTEDESKMSQKELATPAKKPEKKKEPEKKEPEKKEKKKEESMEDIDWNVGL